jgi:spermidine/putrescine transport system ATP-binding protein
MWRVARLFCFILANNQKRRKRMAPNEYLKETDNNVDNTKSFQDMIILTNLRKMYGDFVAVENTTLNIKKGEFLTFLGSSGCGKTTTLRMIAGFEDPTDGSILINGQHAEHLPPNRRDVNTVFQNYALFPHLTVWDNIAFGLKLKKYSKKEIRQKVEDVIKLVKLEEHAEKAPEQLSGGQKQRVAIARALVNNPKVLLLDEPLGALDLKLRKEMQLELKQLQKQLKITIIYVTHDQEEALTMSDRIVVMNHGHIEQIGTAKEIYEKPATKFVAQFIGETNLFEDAVVKQANGNEYRVEVGGQEIRCLSELKFNENDSVHLSVRPENMVVSKQPKENMNFLKVIFSEKIYVGNLTKCIAFDENKQRQIIATQFSEDVPDLEEGKEIYVN